MILVLSLLYVLFGAFFLFCGFNIFIVSELWNSLIGFYFKVERIKNENKM